MLILWIIIMLSLELIYAFNKVGIKINIINDILDDRIYEADY